ncbi:hypothetical protein MKX07_008497 [Trichoderma sp. CBMAI-0711]|nr:hypothetical protein MKX07_008497 [Trichoderma sp. CBMAI-0711]
MSIDQLADQVEQAMRLANQAPSDDTTSPSTGPALPPQLAMNRNKTVDEVLADLNKSPLFMTEMEEDNDDIAALQALAYEGSALENAADFKERGNECFKVRGYKDASEFYGKGISVLFLEERKRARGEVTKHPETGEPDSEEEIRKQREMLEAMYVNRAACHLEMQNYRSCWTDCAAAIRLNPRNVKAYYRSARALLAVDRIEEADDVCARGLAIDPENKALRSVAESIVKRAQTLAELKRKADAREAQKQRRALLLKTALAARGIATRSTEQPPEMEDAKVRLVPDEDDAASELAFPTVLLYPLHLESDFIKAFQETHCLEDHLSYIFPLPWDKEGEYTLGGVTCYVETKDGGLIKMGKKVPLLKVLSGGKVEVVDEVVKIFVVPTGKAEGWVKEFKEKRAAERGQR